MADDDDEERWLQFRSDVQHTIDNLIRQYWPRDLPTGRWVLAVEVMDEEGKAIVQAAPPDATPWDTLGILEHIRQTELAHTIRRHLD